MRKLYLAAPLFTPVERAFNEEVAGKLATFFNVFLPQRDGVLIPGARVGKEQFDLLSREAYLSDVEAITASEIVFAVLDGRTIDEGVAFELGYGAALGKRCVALKTDSRVLLPHGDNPMIVGSISEWISSVDQIAQWARSSSGG